MLGVLEGCFPGRIGHSMVSCFNMTHQQFMQHLRAHAARHPAHRPCARAYRNGAGVDVLIFLPQSQWAYVDWLEACGDICFADWVLHCEQTPSPGFTLSHLLMYWLWLDEYRRHRQGLPTHTPIPPEGYGYFREAINDTVPF